MEDPIFQILKSTPLGVDTCSLIYLQKTGLLEKFSQRTRLFISDIIYLELCQFPQNEKKRKIHESRKEFFYLIKEKKIQVLSSLSIKKKSSEILSKKIHPGEASLLRLFYEGKVGALLTDDGKLAAYCSRHEIPFFNALIAGIFLYKEGILSLSVLKKKLLYLEKTARYQEWIIRYAHSQISEPPGSFSNPALL